MVFLPLSNVERGKGAEGQRIEVPGRKMALKGENALGRDSRQGLNL